MTQQMPGQLPPVPDDADGPRPNTSRQQLPPGAARGQQSASFEERFHQMEAMVHQMASVGGDTTRQTFEKQAILAYAGHVSFPAPLLNMGDVLLAAQTLTDMMQKRGFFTNTSEFKPSGPSRVQRAQQRGQTQQRSGDDPQGGDHKVLVSYPESSG